MTFLLRTLLAIAMWLISACSASAQSAAPPAAGRWQGAIHIPEHELSITVDLDDVRDQIAKTIGGEGAKYQVRKH